MRFLDRRRVLSNIHLAARYLNGSPPLTAAVKSDFIGGLNRAQSTIIRSLDDDIYLEFDNPGLVTRLLERTVFSPDEVAEGAHLFSSRERSQVTNLVDAAKDLLSREIPNLYYLITQVIGSVAAYRIPQRDGGSVSCNIGLIWLSPRTDWTVEYCGEMLVHEFIHNSVFLEDMVRGIMPTPELLEQDDALSISAIRQTRRPYDKAFHSACVAAGIMYYYHAIGRDFDAQRHFAPLERTIENLHESDKAVKRSGCDLLTKNGRDIVNELRRFITGGPDYLSIAHALAP
jgi:HEXXH motif-containing protein